MDGKPEPTQCAGCSDIDLRDARGILETRITGRESLAELPGTGRDVTPVHSSDGLHSRGVSPCHGSSLLRFMGLPDHRIFRSLRILRYASGLDVSDRRTASS